MNLEISKKIAAHAIRPDRHPPLSRYVVRNAGGVTGEADLPAGKMAGDLVKICGVALTVTRTILTIVGARTPWQITVN